MVMGPAGSGKVRVRCFTILFVLTLSCQYCWIELDLRCFVMWLHSSILKITKHVLA